MANRIDEENDYLQSLFLKPFCQKMQQQVILDKVRNSISNRNQNDKKRQFYNQYNFIVSHDQPRHSNKIHNLSYDRNISNRPIEDKKITPYQSRKIEQQNLSKQLKDNIKGHEIPKVLRNSQDSWLIIKELQTKLKQSNIRKKQFNKTHKNQLSIQQISETIMPQHRKKYSESQIKKSTKTQVSLDKNKEQSKNIKSMMSYYKNKRAIKQMSKINGGSFNLTNTHIEQSINLKVQTGNNKNAEKIQELIQKIKKSYHRNKTIKMKVKNKKIDFFNFSTDKIKIPLKSTHINPFNIQTRQLHGILNSFKMDMSEKQKRPKTSTRIIKSEHYSPSRKTTVHKKFNDVTGWQNYFQKSLNETVCLI